MCLYCTCRTGADSGSSGDWWTQLESDPSTSSNTQLHQPLIRRHEFTSSLLQLEMAQGLNRGEVFHRKGFLFFKKINASV